MPDTSIDTPPHAEASHPVPDRRWSLRRWAIWTIVGAVAVSIASIGVGGLAVYRLSDARDKVVNQLDPAVTSVLALSNALINQETGVRGYALSAQDDFLTPYTQGRHDQQAAEGSLRASLGTTFPAASDDLDSVTRAATAWRSGYAEPTITAVRNSQTPVAAGNIDEGKALFDQVRADVAVLDSHLRSQQTAARDTLSTAAAVLQWSFTAIAVALIAAAIMLSVGLTRGVIRPLTALTDQVRHVAGGDFTHPVQVGGPREIHQLGGDVESMRQRILTELSAVQSAHHNLDAQATDLRRSNTELEQFAYVASHDLQEPLRKVASFCELLADRYTDALDERGRTYIGFAVDGATRMQSLINDLLAFSRVGRLGGSHVLVETNILAAQALANLSTAIDAAEATVTIGELPPLYGDPALLTAVFQNLIGNAVKFHAPDAPPQITLTADADGDRWLFTCTDNGIGIEADYAERVFVIFQRLHAKSSYPGTGIGLAMCRKIIEYHGGSIWLDTTRPPGTPGTKICFTIPMAETADARLAS